MPSVWPGPQPAVHRAAAALALLALGALAAGGCRWVHAGPPPGIAARVNGQDISMAALDRAVAAQTGGRPLAGDQLQQLRLALLAELVDERVALQQAHAQGISAPAEEVQTSLRLARLREPDTPPAQLRHRLARHWVLTHFFAREIGRVAISAAAIAAYYHSHPAEFTVAEPRYHVREILIATHARPGPQLPAQPHYTLARARRQLKLIAAQLKAGTPFALVAREYSDSAATAESGGDLGLIPESALAADTPGALRQALLLLQPGQLSPPIATARGFYILKLVAKEMPGQESLADPAVRDRIGKLLRLERQQTLKTALMTTLRDRAHVENYFAERLLQHRSQP
ncbi:MAG: peptidylprolyl isomerase [Terriglobales bacterium]